MTLDYTLFQNKEFSLEQPYKGRGRRDDIANLRHTIEKSAISVSIVASRLPVGKVWQYSKKVKFDPFTYFGMPVRNTSSTLGFRFPNRCLMRAQLSYHADWHACAFLVLLHLLSDCHRVAMTSGAKEIEAKRHEDAKRRHDVRHGTTGEAATIQGNRFDRRFLHRIGLASHVRHHHPS